MAMRYGVIWSFCDRKSAGKKIIEILKKYWKIVWQTQNNVV
jgi:hypothetical protein